MKALIDNYKSNLTFILLIIYSLGFIYLEAYYSRFNIKIENYISLPEIIFVTIRTLAYISIIYAIIEFVLFLLAMFVLKLFYSKFLARKKISDIKDPNLYEKYYELVLSKKIDDGIKGVSFFLFILITFISIFFSSEYILILTIFFPILIIKIYQIDDYKDDNEKKRITQILLTSLILILFVCFGIWGFVDGNQTKKQKPLTIVEFSAGKKLFNTKSDSLNFIGETGNYIFIYDIQNRKSLIFDKSNISNFQVKDITLSEEEKEIIIKESEKKVNEFLKKYNLNN